jgi:hypothetical protein
VFTSLNLRLNTDGVLHPVITDTTALAGLYPFPRVAPGTRDVRLIIRPLWAFARGVGQVGTLPEFVLRFDQAALAYPPGAP